MLHWTKYIYWCDKLIWWFYIEVLNFSVIIVVLTEFWFVPKFGPSVLGIQKSYNYKNRNMASRIHNLLSKWFLKIMLGIILISNKITLGKNFFEKYFIIYRVSILLFKDVQHYFCLNFFLVKCFRKLHKM